MRHLFPLVLLAGLALGLTASSCSCGAQCSAETCAGCCDAYDTCQQGLQSNSCGIGGAACDICLDGFSCNAGFCNPGTGGGTGGGATGGGSGTGGTGGSGSAVVSGRVTYDFVPTRFNANGSATLNFAATAQHPVRNAQVQILQGTTAVATTNTADDGTYSLAYTANGTAAQVVVQAKTANPPIQVQDNTASGAVWSLGAALNGASQTVDLNATSGWTGTTFNAATRTAAPFAVLDSMFTASRAFMAVRTVSFPLLKVNWSPNNVPQSGNKALGQISTSHYAPNENQIYVLGKTGVDTDEFDSHVIVHEWGHSFEANLSRSDSPGGPHGGEVLDPRIAFGEAWGDAVASMVLPETPYVDTMWNGAMLSGWGMDLETIPSPTDDPQPGPFSESSLMRFLYDVYDPANESFDTLAGGLGLVYDVMHGPEKTTDSVTTVGSFVKGLKDLGADATQVNTLLAKYNMGAITSQWGDGDTNLRGMFTAATARPYTGSVNLVGGNAPNTYQQNQYWVFTGTGATTSVSATSARDVSVAVYRNGVLVGWADANTSGTETATFGTQGVQNYVVVVTGYSTAAGNYSVSVSIP